MNKLTRLVRQGYRLLKIDSINNELTVMKDGEVKTIKLYKEV